MKKILVFIAYLFLIFCFVACSNKPDDGLIPTSPGSSSVSSISPPDLKAEAERDNSMYKIQMVVGGQIFPMTLYKNETTDALMALLPMTIDMGDMNGNEKYYYFLNNLPTNPKRPAEIHAGDLLLYGSDCLVLFYENFSSSYSYTSLGYLENSADLVGVLGSGKVQVLFREE